jgi:hypothetical protein
MTYTTNNPTTIARLILMTAQDVSADFRVKQTGLNFIAFLEQSYSNLYSLSNEQVIQIVRSELRKSGYAVSR